MRFDGLCIYLLSIQTVKGVAFEAELGVGNYNAHFLIRLKPRKAEVIGSFSHSLRQGL